MHDLPFNKPARPTNKLAEVIAAKIERTVIDMGWPVGALIGSEADLTNRYNVSRAIFREAVRLLEADMVARMKPGPNGGLIVVAPDGEGVAHAMALFLQYERVGVQQLLDIRSLIEGHAAALAAEHGSAKNHDALRALMSDEETCVRRDWQSAKNFHILIARMGGNPVAFLIARSLIMMTEQQTTPMHNTRQQTASHVHRVHEKIGDAILARDPDKARELMVSHILALDPWLGEANQSGRSTRD